MSAGEILLVGAGGHAQSCIEAIESDGRFRIAGLVGSALEVGKSVLGYPVIGTDDALPDLLRRCSTALIAVGQVRPSPLRRRLFELVRTSGFELPAIVASDAVVSRHAILGAGVVVMHGAIINAGAQIGDNSILNSRCLVEHGAVIGGHCHVATGAIVNGEAQVGAGSTLGSGCIVREGRYIGRDCLVGMGLVVRHDQPDGSTFKG